MAILYNLHGEQPPANLRDVLALCVYLLIRQSARRGCRRSSGGYIVLFITACPRVTTLAALQTAGVFLSVLTITLHFVRCRQHSRQQPTSRCHGLVIVCGNRGNSDAVVEWIPAAMIVQFAR